MEGGVEAPVIYSIIEPKYEFSAPQYFDFSYEETQEDIDLAESWFKNAIPYEASPHASKTRSVAELFTAADNSGQKSDKEAQQILAHVSPSPKQLNKQDTSSEEGTSECDESCEEDTVLAVVQVAAPVDPRTPAGNRLGQGFSSVVMSPIQALVTSPLPAKRLYSQLCAETAPTAALPKVTPRRSSAVRRSHNLRKDKGAVRKAHALEETRARKKQKLEGGRIKQTAEGKPKIILTVPQEFRFCTDTRARAHGTDTTTQHTTDKTLQRCFSVQEIRPVSPFISMAERVHRFQQKTPERFHMLPSGGGSSQLVEIEKQKPLKLTKPKTPELGTMQRVRPSRIKSSAEIEEEMMANLPRFKARPLPKKILEAPTLPFVVKSTPQVPEFQEFHLHTLERAQQNPKNALLMLSSTQNAESDSDAALKERRNSAPGGTTGSLTEPGPPRLQTALRARPTTVKSTAEIEAEELAKMPKFKARPLNKRIFKSKGDLGVPRNHKRQITMPVEFRFQTGQRAQVRGPPLPIEEFDKLSLQREQSSDSFQAPTAPKPFRLTSDDRGLAKKMKMIQEQIEREQKEAEARIPKAQPLPYTTKSPIVPPKPAPKVCTRPVPFQLVSLTRHEEEQQRLAAERAQSEQLEKVLKEFRAQPNLSNAPVFMPVRSNKPLTEISEFKFNVDSRAVERAEFDKKVAEKQNLYKHYREEYEAARKAEEEKFIKAMRREMVIIARPVPKFDRPFVPQRSTKEPTRPVSPKFNLKTPKTDSRPGGGRSWAQDTPIMQRRIQMR